MRKQIVIVERAAGFEAHMKEEFGTWEYGDTIWHAIEKLVQIKPEVHGREVVLNIEWRFMPSC